MATSKITVEQKLHIQVLYESGVKTSQLIKQFNITEGVVRKYAKAGDWKANTTSKKYFDSQVANRCADIMAKLNVEDEIANALIKKLALEEGKALAIANITKLEMMERIRIKHLSGIDEKLDIQKLMLVKQKEILVHINPKEMKDFEIKGMCDGKEVIERISVYRLSEIKPLPDLTKDLQGLGILQSPTINNLTQINLKTPTFDERFTLEREIKEIKEIKE